MTIKASATTSSSNTGRGQLKKQLPKDYVPSPICVVLGRDGPLYKGNQRLRDIVSKYSVIYSQVNTKQEKTDLVNAIIREVTNTTDSRDGDDSDTKSANVVEPDRGYFAEKNEDDGYWYEADRSKIRDKVGGILRELLHSRYKSSSKSKRSKAKQVKMLHKKKRMLERTSHLLPSPSKRRQSMPAVSSFSSSSSPIVPSPVLTMKALTKQRTPSPPPTSTSTLVGLQKNLYQSHLSRQALIASSSLTGIGSTAMSNMVTTPSSAMANPMMTMSARSLSSSSSSPSCACGALGNMRCYCSSLQQGLSVLQDVVMPSSSFPMNPMADSHSTTMAMMNLQQQQQRRFSCPAGVQTTNMMAAMTATTGGATTPPLLSYHHSLGGFEQPKLVTPCVSPHYAKMTFQSSSQLPEVGMLLEGGYDSEGDDDEDDDMVVGVSDGGSDNTTTILEGDDLKSVFEVSTF